MDRIAKMISDLIAVEGGYTNDPSDAGGETNFGITIATARKYGYVGPMIEMPRAVAEDIYRRRYFVDPGFDKVAELSSVLAVELFDTGVNMGVGKAGEFLQVSLNALNKQGTLYPDIQEDGAIGPRALSALRAFLAARGAEGEAVLLKALNCLQGARYIEISRGRAANEDFVFGWLKNRVTI